MKEIDNNSMKQKNMPCPYLFFGLRNTNRKNPHKYIGGKKEKSSIKIKVATLFLCFFFQCLIHEIWLHIVELKIPL